MKFFILIICILVSGSVFCQNVTLINSQADIGQCGEVRQDNNLNFQGVIDFSTLTDAFTIISVIIEDDCLVIEASLEVDVTLLILH